jgi:hypothetical protein
LPEVKKILNKQKENDSFGTISKNPLTETWRQLRFLIDRYGFNKRQSAVIKTAEFIFSCRLQEGDIRGILGNWYAPYYTGARSNSRCTGFPPVMLSRLKSDYTIICSQRKIPTMLLKAKISNPI